MVIGIIPRPGALSLHEAERNWRHAHYFNLYRIILAGIFVAGFYVSDWLPALGTRDPRLFEFVCLGYLGIALGASVVIQFRLLEFRVITPTLVILDILALILLMRASGGIESGLGMLLIVAIAGNSLLLGSQSANLFAAIAALAVLAEQVLAYLEATLKPDFTQAGILGIALFMTAYLAHTLSNRIRESEALAAQRGVDLANLTALNQHVVQHMQSGIIVVDEQLHIRLINDAAWQMLGLPSFGRAQNQSLKVLSPELAEQLIDWRRGNLTEPRIFRPGLGPLELLPSMTALGRDERAGALIFLEDATRMAQQAQQLKLASLGRLTASIAHEIRNPLGAISHAEQLLAEGSHHARGDQRLLEIIHTNTARVNHIIENVLQLSRGQRANREDIDLKRWLGAFIEEFSHSQNCRAGDIVLRVEPENCVVNMDATQLHQVLWNLCSNGLRYSPPVPGRPRLELTAGIQNETRKPFLEIIDFGPGVDPALVQHIFEPFFTTESKGSGLGLFIASELCRGNNARLNYYPGPGGGSCFRIDFSATRQPAAAALHPPLHTPLHSPLQSPLHTTHPLLDNPISNTPTTPAPAATTRNRR